MKITLSCPVCKNIKVFLVNGVVNSNTIIKFFKDNKAYCELCKGNRLGNIIMNVAKFDRETQASTEIVAHELHVPTTTDPKTMTEEQKAKKEEMKKKLLMELSS